MSDDERTAQVKYLEGNLRRCTRRVKQLERGIMRFLEAEKAGEMSNLQAAIEHLERLIAQI